MNIKYENQGMSMFLVCELDAEEQIDELSMGMLKNNKIPGILPVSFVQTDAKRYLRWNITSKVDLASYLKNKISKIQFLNIISGICDAFIVTEDYLMDNDRFIPALQYIYIDAAAGNTSLIYLPVIRKTAPVDLNMLIKKILVSGNFEEEEDTGYIMPLMNRLNQPGRIPASELKEVIDELKRSADKGEAEESVRGQKSENITADAPYVNERPEKVTEADSSMPGGIRKPTDARKVSETSGNRRDLPEPESDSSDHSNGVQRYPEYANFHDGNLPKEPENHFAYEQNVPWQNFDRNGYETGQQGGRPWEEYSEPMKFGQYQDIPMPGRYQEGPMPSKYQDGPMPGQLYQNGPMPGQLYQNGPMPGQYQDGPMPGQYQEGLMPGQYQEGPMPGQYRDEYMQGTTGSGTFMSNSQPAASNGKNDSAPKGLFGFVRKKRSEKKEARKPGTEQNKNNFAGTYPGAGNSGQINGYGPMQPNPFMETGGSGQINGYGSMQPNPFMETGGSGQINGYGPMQPNPFMETGSSGQINGYGPAQQQFSILDDTMAGSPHMDFQPPNTGKQQTEQSDAGIFSSEDETTVLGLDPDSGEAEDVGMNKRAAVTEYVPTASVKRKKTGKAMEIRKDIFHLGREEKYADFCIPDNIAVSKNHANIICRDKKYFLKDNNSLNHTYLNGEKLTGNTEYELRSGDTILLANEEFEFRLR